MNIVYEPRGKAREYAALAANIYLKCQHGCTYCYCPRVLRSKRDEVNKHVRPRQNWETLLESDFRSGKCTDAYVFFSFIGDILQPHSIEHGIAEHILSLCLEHRVRPMVLTKAHVPQPSSERILQLIADCKGRFGISLVWTNDTDRTRYEPNAGSVEDRLRLLHLATSMGIDCFVSIEPVIDPSQALHVCATAANINAAALVGFGNPSTIPGYVPFDKHLFCKQAVDIVSHGRFLFKHDTRPFLPAGVLPAMLDWH